MSELIYFDNNATTRLDDEVLEHMLPWMTNLYGNPSSQHHFGMDANKAVREARLTIAAQIGCYSDEIIFTSGATESINIALKGAAFQASNKRNKIITFATEHKAVLDTCLYLEQVGFEVIYLSVNELGLIAIDRLIKEIDEETIAVCAMMVNNETGTLLPISKIASLCHQHDALLICDATQAFGKMEVSIAKLNVDLMSFSAHKFHGLKGIGGLYVRRGTDLAGFIHGGGHESGLRSGTLNVPCIVGMAVAMEIANRDLEKNNILIRELRDLLEKEILAIPGTKFNGHPTLRPANITNISLPGVDAATLIAELQILAVSNGSACTSSVLEPSHVLSAMGLSDERAFAAIRFSLSKYNKREEVNQVVSLLKDYLQTRALP